MQKTILITGSTDGIGLATAKAIAELGHRVILHGRNSTKLQAAIKDIKVQGGEHWAKGIVADLSSLAGVVRLAKEVEQTYGNIDVLINNAGVYKTPNTLAESGLDLRFVVNTLAPYLLTKSLLSAINSGGRVINLSSAAQAPVDLRAFRGETRLSDTSAYAQSKLALTMWSRHLALSLGKAGPVVVAVNPKSLLGSKMVKDAYGVAGADLSIGSDILTKAALSDEFADASGKYYDNDIERFASPHADALDDEKCARIVSEMEGILQKTL